MGIRAVWQPWGEWCFLGSGGEWWARADTVRSGNGGVLRESIFFAVFPFWVLIQGRLWLPIKLKALEGRRSSSNRQSLSHVQLFATPWTAVRQAPLHVEFSRQEYWSRSPFPPPGDRPNPGVEPASLASPALAGRALYPWASWEAHWGRYSRQM